MLSWLESADASMLLWLQGLRGPLDIPLIYFTHLGDLGFLWLALSCLLLAYPQTRRLGRLSLMALFIGFLINNLIVKPLVARPRPWLEVAGLVTLITPPTDPHSFPSGHSCAAFAAAVVWAKGLPWRWLGRVGVVLAVAMAFSRLYVGVHYPSDVVVGALLGTLSGYLALRWL